MNGEAHEIAKFNFDSCSDDVFVSSISPGVAYDVMNDCNDIFKINYGMMF